MHDRLTNVESLTLLPPTELDWEKGVPYSFISLGIVIEYLSGDVRTKVNGEGLTISSTMPSAYGYILRTTDAHGEEVDMYLSMMPSEDAEVYVIDQINPTSGQFDEHKVMLGFGSVDEAVHTHLSVFTDGSGENRLGSVSTFTKDAFLSWVMTDASTVKSAASFITPNVTHTPMKGIASPVKATQDTPAKRDEAGGVVVTLPDLSQGPKIKTTSSVEGCFDYHLYLYSGLGMYVWSNTVDTFCRLLDLATAQDKVHIHIASPGGSVLLLGRMISAINRTKAKVITYAEGCVASAATAIWVAGHERIILPGAYFMQHMSSQLMLGKTTDIAAKSIFAVSYIEKQLQRTIDIGLFTQEEVTDMVDKSADIYISGREAINRIGAHS